MCRLVGSGWAPAQRAPVLGIRLAILVPAELAANITKLWSHGQVGTRKCKIEQRGHYSLELADTPIQHPLIHPPAESTCRNALTSLQDSSGRLMSGSIGEGGCVDGRVVGLAASSSEQWLHADAKLTHI